MVSEALSRRPVISMVTGGKEPLVDGQDGFEEFFDQISAAVSAGVDVVQVRERNLPDRILLEVVTRCLDLARGSETNVLVNDRLDVALAAGADGVHLRACSMPTRIVRRNSPARFLLGRSAHDLEEAVRAVEGDDLDYLIFGTVFASRSKPDVSPCGVGMLREVARAVNLPVLAIGGVTADKSIEVFRAGAAGVAAIGLFTETDSSDRCGGIRRVVEEIRRSYSRNHA